MHPSDVEVLVDKVFAYPEVGDCMCPVRVRNRLAKLLADDAPIVYRTDDAIVWLGNGAIFTLYAAASAAALESTLPQAIAALAPLARAEGAESSQVFATSDAAVAAFTQCGYSVTHPMQRLQHSAPTPRPLDPRVRLRTPDDLAGVVRVAHAVFPEQGWTDDEWSRPFHDQAVGWIAVVDDQPVGFLTVDLTANEALIVGLGVIPTMRRSGLASALVDRALDFAVANDRTKVGVYANDTPQAMGCYARAGFGIVRPGWELTGKW